MAQALATPVLPSISLICSTNSSKPAIASFSFPTFTPSPKVGGLSIRCARVGGVEIPNNKRVEYSLQYIHGIGRTRARQILGDLTMENKITKDLSEEELTTLRNEVSKYMIEGNLIAIVGGGYVAVEFAGIINGLGNEVNVFIRQKKVLRGFDEEIRDFMCEQMALKGIELHAEESPQAITKQPNGLLSVLTNKETVDGFSHVMIATGRRPNTKNFGLEAVGIKMLKEGLSMRFQL